MGHRSAVTGRRWIQTVFYAAEHGDHPLAAAPPAPAGRLNPNPGRSLSAAPARPFEPPRVDAAGREIRPQRTLWLLSIAHAFNHGQAVLLPLIYLKVIDEFGASLQEIAFVAAASAVASGLVQATYAFVTRRVARRPILAAGQLLFGLGFATLTAAQSFGAFALTTIVSRVGGSPQHPVGNGLLAEQFPPERRGFAISAHISGGNVGTVVAAVAGPLILATFGWRGASILFGLPAALIGLVMFRWIRESGSDRLAAIRQGSVRDAARTIAGDPTIRRTYVSSVFGGGGRGLGDANLFAMIYLTEVLGLPKSTTDLMYAGLIVLSVPMPLVAGWLSDRYGRRPLILGAYLGGAAGFILFITVGSSLLGLWLGIAVMGLFSFAESPQLQALLADVVPTGVRDVAFALYFAAAFGIGQLWTIVYGIVINAAGTTAGLPIVFGLMAASFIGAAIVMFP